jgi:nucleoid DNA-binding protein
VNKSELIDAIADSADISKAAAGRALDGAVEAVKNALKKGDMVTLVGFGSFCWQCRTHGPHPHRRSQQDQGCQPGSVPEKG